MKRSAGITISAVLVFAGSALTLLFAALIALSAAVSVPNGNLPHGFRYIAMGVVVWAILFVIWGIASGMGLLHRREWARISILVVSARGQESDKIAALDLGADDYVAKPFTVGELMARIRAALRRSAAAVAGAVFRFGHVEVDSESRVVRVDG